MAYQQQPVPLAYDASYKTSIPYTVKFWVRGTDRSQIFPDVLSVLEIVRAQQ